MPWNDLFLSGVHETTKQGRYVYKYEPCGVIHLMRHLGAGPCQKAFHSHKSKGNKHTPYGVPLSDAVQY
jgi:hypothetical protein